MITVGEVEAVEGAAFAFTDVLGDFEVIIGIIAREPLVGEVVSV